MVIETTMSLAQSGRCGLEVRVRVHVVTSTSAFLAVLALLLSVNDAVFFLSSLIVLQYYVL
jgi:hypothetical protein